MIEYFTHSIEFSFSFEPCRAVYSSREGEDVLLFYVSIFVIERYRVLPIAGRHYEVISQNNCVILIKFTVMELNMVSCYPPQINRGAEGGRGAPQFRFLRYDGHNEFHSYVQLAA